MERIPKLIKFPKKILEDIQAYQQRHHISTFTGALLELVRKGLEKE